MEIGAGFARAVWAELDAAHISQAELARRSGIPVRSLRRIMLAEVDVKLRQMRAISDALGLHCSELVGHAERLAD